MPFYKRTVEPRSLCRFNKDGLQARACCVFNRDSFSTLDAVNFKVLINVLHQLSDLSRHASSIFLELQTEAAGLINKTSALQCRLDALHVTVADLNHKRIKIPVSSLDEESKWSVHYTAPWHQQENVFLPGSRPTCVDDLHRQAKVNLKTVLRECDKLRKDGFRSSQYYSQSPAFSSSSLCENVHLEKEKTEKNDKGSDSPTEEEKLVYSMPPQTPLLEHGFDLNIQGSWTSCSPLPTPEEKMRLQAQTVLTDIIPINITGENFDRQASFRRSISNTDTIIRRSKRVQRRKTITGVPDNIQTELDKEQDDSRLQSMGMADQHSTLCRAGSVNSTLRRMDSRDSSCQTEQLKIVPPSVRRIRAQKGHGIAAQMANASPSTSSISTMSECNSISYTQLNGSDQSFYSLPRISHQPCEPKYSSSPYRMNSGSTSSLPYQFDMQHGSLASLPDSKSSPKSGEFQNEHLIASYHGCDQNNSLTLFSLSDALQNSFAGQNRPEDDPMQSPHSSAQLLSSADASLSGTSSCYESTTSLCTGIHTETESQCSTLDSRNRSYNCVRRGSDFSESSNQSCSTLTNDQWTYEIPPKDQLTSSCSSPVSHIYNSQEHSPSKTDTSSLFSADKDGYYTSRRLESGMKSHSHGRIHKEADTRHSLYECNDHHSQSDCASLHSNRSLTRSISLRKAKKPPLPPARTDSLRRKPQRKSHHSGSVLSEQLISSLQQSLELNLQTQSASFPGHAANGFEDPWVLRPRSKSTVSATSSGMSAPAAACPITPTHSDSSSQPSDYAESWDFYMDYPGPRSDQGVPSQITRHGGSEENPGVVSNGSYNSGFPSAYCNGIKSKLVSSPEKVHRLTSPSSGYSSQSNTPTAGTPVTSLLRVKCPTGRPKPKVPERKSSLLSSVSSSSTSLSSNTSDSIKNIPPPPPLPDITTGQCVTPSPISSCLTATTIDSDAPPLSQHDVSSALEQNSPSHVPTPEKYERLFDGFLDFVPDSTKVSETLSLNEGTISPPPPPLLPPPEPSSCIQSPLPPPPPPPPPLPEISLQTAAIFKKETSRTSTESVESEKGLNLNRFEEPEKRPKITAQALKMVHLRPVKLMQIESIFTAVSVRHFEDQAEYSQNCSGKSLQSETAEKTVIASCVGETENGVETSDNKGNPLEASYHFLPPGTDDHVTNTKTGQNGPMQTSEPLSIPNDLPFHEIAQCTDSTLQNSPSKQKPPISPKKPNLALIIPPNNQVSNGMQLQQVQETAVTPDPEPVNDTDSTDVHVVHLQEIPLGLEAEEETDSGSSTPVVKGRLSFSSDLSSSSLQDLQLSDPILHEHDEDLGLSDDKNTSDDGLSSSSGSISFKEDENEENGASLDSSTESSPSKDVNGKVVEEMVTPVRPRTTEDLFAAIHRSKRKVLGRCDSEEERCRSVPPSPPITPTGSCPSLSSLPRQSSSIQRNLRRSSTSNDSFKALLLKKGSRSESGFRMSAAEILKCTDPRFQKTVSESPQSDGLCTSPTGNRRVSEEWARTEGALPRLSAGLTTLKYGRSRTPPSAASSRYNSRSRNASGPMTAICEREGEMAESQDGSFTLPLTSSGTVCSQGST
nr:NHS-like protein 1 isoform X2 [Misgurnus anguillicaudatus]